MPVTRRKLIGLAAAAASAATFAFVAPGRAVEAATNTVVFAAASLKTALDSIVAQYQKASGKTVKVSYAASSTLAKQIEQGAPADLFISADLDWMDYVAGRDLIKSGSRLNLLANELVLIATKDSTATVEVGPGFDLAKLLGDGRLAIGQVASVPAGKYGKAALESLGVWASVSGRLAEAENVRAALLLVSRGEAPFGIVYKTDAISDPTVKIIATFPQTSHAPIVYPIALTAGAKDGASAVLEYIEGPEAKALFEAQGFSELPLVKTGYSKF